MYLMSQSAARTANIASRDLVRVQLQRILASSIFANSQRLSRFLQFVVERSMEGKADDVKEYAIGVEVFERDSGFDPRIDPIVRVQAAKLRSKLLEYYNGEGKTDALVISIPKGGYAPVFACVQPAGEKPLGSARASVAVLPFVNMSAEADNEYFSDGLTEEIINTLTSVPGLQVVARTSVFRFKGQHQDVREIGNQLNAGTILEGSVRRAGAQLRITAQLINVKDGYHLWSHTFKRELRDVFAVQEEISEAVRAALAPHFGVAPAAARAQRHEPSIEAHELYLKGRYAQAQLVGGNVAQSVGLFEQAIAADPSYARAYAGLADAWFYLAFWGSVRPHDAIPKAKEAAQKSLALDENLPEAHASLGSIQGCYEWNWPEARRSLDRALQLDPDFANGWVAYVNQVLLPNGQVDEALAALRKAIKLDPFSPYPQACVTFLLGIQGKIDEAVEQHTATLTTNPNYFFAHGTMAHAFEANGRFAEALGSVNTALAASSAFRQALTAKARILASAGEADQARRALRQVLEAKPARYVAPTDVAAVHAALRDRRQALAWLERAIDERSMHLYLLPTDPRFRWLHSAPEFRAIVDRIGLRLPE
jgi:TolB-like protein/Tfp pilus assembly protein PilF